MDRQSLAAGISRLGQIFALRKTAPILYQRQQGRWTGRSAAGIFVSPETALRNATVWACHRYLTQTVGQLPFRILKMRQDGSGTSERLPQSPALHPTDYVLNWRPNPELGPFQLKETLVGWALMWGNGFAEIERDGAGRLANLWPIEPWRVRILRDNETHDLIYRVNNQTLPPTDIAPMDIFHIRGFGNGPVGLSIIEHAAQTIGWAQATELFGATYFGEGMHFSGVVQLKGRGDPEGIERMKEEMENRHQGVGRSNRFMFLDDGATVTKMNASPNEAQYIDTLQFQVESICVIPGTEVLTPTGPRAIETF
jgi:HK97 family phage portal protein